MNSETGADSIDLAGFMADRLVVWARISGVLFGLLALAGLLFLSFSMATYWGYVVLLLVVFRIVAIRSYQKQPAKKKVSVPEAETIRRLSLLFLVSDSLIIASAHWAFLAGLPQSEPTITILALCGLAVLPAVYPYSLKMLGVAMFAVVLSVGLACWLVAAQFSLAHLLGVGIVTVSALLAPGLGATVAGLLKQQAEQEKQKEQQREANYLLNQHWQNTPLAGIDWNKELKITNWNPSAELMFGYTAGDAIGQSLELIFAPGEVEKIRRRWQRQWLSRLGERSIHECRHKNGKSIFCEWHDSILTRHGEAVGVASFVEDITLQVKAEEIVKNQANVDSLTGLPNRRQMMAEIDRAISRSQRNDNFGALIFVDLDYFKDINDTQGHDVGDEVLKEFGSRLQSVVRVQDMVARFGGDEFVVLLEGLGESRVEAQQNVQIVADKMLGIGQALWRVAGISYDVDLSGGIVLFDGNSGNGTELLKNADMAMYRVKQSGRRGISFYDSSLAAQAEHRVELINSLRQGVERSEFELYFQPIVNAEGKIAFAETLLRWNRDKQRVITASHFMDVMSNSPMINQVGYWTVEQACHHLNQLKSNGGWPPGAALFLNVSGKQLADTQFSARLFETLQEHNVDVESLILEIAEDAVISRRTETMKQLKNLKQGGIRIALDDFGVGYSSLTLLEDVGADFVKLDNSLVARLSREDHEQVLRTVIELCKSLSLKVIAEGVENQSQYDQLTQFGCDLFQGYHFYRPMPEKDFYGQLRTDSDNGKGLRLVT